MVSLSRSSRVQRILFGRTGTDSLFDPLINELRDRGYSTTETQPSPLEHQELDRQAQKDLLRVLWPNGAEPVTETSPAGLTMGADQQMMSCTVDLAKASLLDSAIVCEGVGRLVVEGG